MNKDFILQVLSYYLINNQVSPSELVLLIENLQHLEFKPIHEYIECKICGGQFKSLNKHISSKHNLKIEDYCTKFNIKAKDLRVN